MLSRWCGHAGSSSSTSGDRVLPALEARDERHGEGGSVTLYDAEGGASVFLTGHADGGEASLSDGENITASLSGKHGLHLR